MELEVWKLGCVSWCLILFIGWADVVRVVCCRHLRHHFWRMAWSYHDGLVLSVTCGCAASSLPNWVLVVVIWGVVNALVTPVSLVHRRFIVFSTILVRSISISQVSGYRLYGCIIQVHFLWVFGALHHKIICLDNTGMDYGAKLGVTHLHLTASEFSSLVLLWATFSLPSVTLGRMVVSWLVRSLLLRSDHLILGVLRRGVLATTISMVDCHIHSVLDICFRLLWELWLVANMLRILEPGGGHAHDLWPVVVLFPLIIVSSRVAYCLELRPVVNSIYLYRAWDHFLRVWSILSSLLRGNLCSLLPALIVITWCIHLFLYFRIVLVLWAKFVDFCLKFQFVPFLRWNIVFIAISSIRALLFHISNIKGRSLLDGSYWCPLTLSNRSALASLVSLWLVLVKLLLHPSRLGTSVQRAYHVGSTCPFGVKEVFILS